MSQDSNSNKYAAGTITAVRAITEDGVRQLNTVWVSDDGKTLSALEPGGIVSTWRLLEKSGTWLRMGTCLGRLELPHRHA